MTNLLLLGKTPPFLPLFLLPAAHWVPSSARDMVTVVLDNAGHSVVGMGRNESIFAFALCQELFGHLNPPPTTESFSLLGISTPS